MTTKPTAMPASRAAASSILRSFLNIPLMEVPGNQSDPDSASPVPIGGKRHLIITGCRGSGKSTLLREILALPYFSGRGPFPGFTTRVVPRDHVELTDNLTGEAVTIGSYQPPAAGQTVSLTPGNQMTPDLSGFLGPGAASVTRAIDSPARWTVIDELGYLEAPVRNSAMRSSGFSIGNASSQSFAVSPLLFSMHCGLVMMCLCMIWTARFFLSDVSSWHRDSESGLVPTSSWLTSMENR